MVDAFPPISAQRDPEGLALVVEVSLPHTECAVAVYYILATAEASANLARTGV